MKLEGLHYCLSILMGLFFTWINLFIGGTPHFVSVINVSGTNWIYLTCVYMYDVYTCDYKRNCRCRQIGFPHQEYKRYIIIPCIRCKNYIQLLFKIAKSKCVFVTKYIPPIFMVQVILLLNSKLERVFCKDPNTYYISAIYMLFIIHVVRECMKCIWL